MVPANKMKNHHRLSQHINIYQFPQNKKLPCFFFFFLTCPLEYLVNSGKHWLDRWIHHALYNWDAVSFVHGVCCCKVLSVTFSTTFDSFYWIWCGMTYCETIAQSFLFITRLLYLILFFAPIYIFFPISKVGYLLYNVVRAECMKSGYGMFIVQHVLTLFR